MQKKKSKISSLHQPVIETGVSAWKAPMLPLHHWCLMRNCYKEGHNFNIYTNAQFNRVCEVGVSVVVTIRRQHHATTPHCLSLIIITSFIMHNSTTTTTSSSHHHASSKWIIVEESGCANQQNHLVHVFYGWDLF